MSSNRRRRAVAGPREFVTAEIELEVPVRTPAKKDDEKDDEGEKGVEEEEEDEDAAAPANSVPASPGPASPGPARERRTFRARSHLIVTVPLYVKWAALDWEDR